MRSSVVPVTDVYERFGGGEHVEYAIHQFFRERMKLTETPLDYVLLAGDATYDRTDIAPFVKAMGPVTSAVSPPGGCICAEPPPTTALMSGPHAAARSERIGRARRRSGVRMAQNVPGPPPASRDP